jgi:hypothetical protein
MTGHALRRPVRSTRKRSSCHRTARRVPVHT